MLRFLYVGSFALGSCATGEGTVDARSNRDSSPTQRVDGAMQVSDARVTIPVDASVDATVDAQPPLFCDRNEQCTAPGTCCLRVDGPGVCGPGIVIGTICVPPL